MPSPRFTPTIGLVAVLLSFGCSTSRETYLRQHPEMPAAQRYILKSGKIPNGEAVAGMTREQIRMAMGSDPAQFTSINGEDAWVWTRQKLTAPAIAESQPYSEPGGIGRQREGGMNPSDRGLSGGQGQPEAVEVRTTVFFKGNLATHAVVADGGH